MEDDQKRLEYEKPEVLELTKASAGCMSGSTAGDRCNSGGIAGMKCTGGGQPGVN